MQRDRLTLQHGAASLVSTVARCRFLRVFPVLMLLLLLVPGLAVPAQALSAKKLGPTLTLVGKAVNFDLSGFEPDFDPIYKVVVSSTLHDGRSAGVALPESTLILSAYLEVFQPDTTPLLP